MSIIDALLLVVFGIVLPIWDVGSDIALAQTFFSKKPCTWENYIIHYNNIIDEVRGKLTLCTYWRLLKQSLSSRTQTDTKSNIFYAFNSRQILCHFGRPTGLVFMSFL